MLKQMHHIKEIKATQNSTARNSATHSNSKIKLYNINDQIKKISLRSTACSALCYFAVTLAIIKAYIAFSGKHPVYLGLTLFNLCFAMGILIYLACKVTYRDSKINFPDETTCLNYQLQRLTSQRKLVSLYMLEYTAVLIISGIFFSGINSGLSLLLKFTLSVSIITYVSGAYFIVISLILTHDLKILQLTTKRKAPLKYFLQN